MWIRTVSGVVWIKTITTAQGISIPVLRLHKKHGWESEITSKS